MGLLVRSFLGIVVASASASTTLAQESLLRNDDLPASNANAAISAGFGPGEVAGATFTLSAAQQAALLPMQIKRVQILWTSYAFQLLGQQQPAVAMESINVYRGGLAPPSLPQPVYFSDPPQLIDGFLNEFDIAFDNVILQGPLTQFTVGLQFDNDPGAAYFQGSPLFRPSVCYDRTTNAIRNPVFAIPGGWQDYVALGGTGDLVIRVVVEKAVITPTGCNLADVTGIGGPPAAPDQQLTVDDIIAVVNAFSDGAGCPGATPCNIADVTGIGGPPSTPDGQLTVDDIIAFVNAFGEGC